MFGFLKKKEPPREPPKRFPPVPDWRPSIVQPLDRIVERVRHYTNGKRDFAVFAHGTAVLLPDGLTDAQAESHAKEALHRVFHAHADMHPMNMKDGNVMVGYNHGALNVVLSEVAAAHGQEIVEQHQRAIATDEVLLTPLGPNKFDELGMKGLFGRCFMFMDAQAPQVVRIERSI